jgi:Na+-translocating ferredoxin:NAD+ oxidoreductase subunit B
MKAVLDKEQCISCELCVDSCAEQAISMDEVAVIDAAKCTGCGTCVSSCPNEAIKLPEA